MSRETAEALDDFLRSEVGDQLRSVIHYDDSGGEVIRVREDVKERYTSRQLENAIRENRLEAIEKPHQEGLYDHGGLDCTVRCFEKAIEMHFIESETEGTVVALDIEAFATRKTFVSRCREIAGLE